MGVVYILIAILIFGLLIATHELGHFLTAKLLGCVMQWILPPPVKISRA